MHVLLCLHGTPTKLVLFKSTPATLPRNKKNPSEQRFRQTILCYVPKHPPLAADTETKLRLNATWFSIVQGLDVSQVQRVREFVLAYSWVYVYQIPSQNAATEYL